MVVKNDIQTELELYLTGNNWVGRMGIRNLSHYCCSVCKKEFQPAEYFIGKVGNEFVCVDCVRKGGSNNGLFGKSKVVMEK